MTSFKALSKQFLGAHYEQMRNSVFAGLIVFVSLYAAEIRIAIAPFILYLTATVFTAGVMWQTLSSSKNAQAMMGLFMLPFVRKRLTFAYTLACSVYTLITKTLVVLALFFAVQAWSLLQIAISLLCACNACAMTAAIYAMTGQKKTLLGVLWVLLIGITLLALRQSAAVLVATLVSLGLAALYLSAADPYLFYRPASAQTATRRSRSKAGVFVYLLRYLCANKNYLINTVGLWAIACFLPLMLGQFEGFHAVPLGFAILCLNTPICILLSCEPSLEQAIRVLPGQAAHFCSRYCLFIFLVNMTTGGIYLASWQLQHGGIDGIDVVTAVLFAFQSAMLSVGLEWFYPLRSWKVESDLWHHPRKYVVPALMLLFAPFVAMWEQLVWVWLCLIVLACCVFRCKARRI